MKLEKLNQIDAYTLASEKLVNLYKSQNGKKFVHHLIDSYSGDNIIFAFYSKKDIYDCLTKSKLRTLFHWDNPLRDEDILRMIKESMEIEDKNEQFSKLMEVDKLIRERYPDLNTSRTALICRDSNKILGVEEFQALVDFIQDQVNSKNQTIINMIKFAKFRNTPDFKSEKPEAIRKNKKSKKKKTKENMDVKLEALVNKYKK